jgi:chromosome partitioning protein
MSTLISIIGAKGGTGKTTLSHMLCYGLGLLGERAVCVMTDIGREPPPAGSLPYVFADGRSAAAREKIVATLRSRPDWYGVIDGGANSLETDVAICQASDLVLLPFRDSQEDLRVACRDLERLPNALALPSQWPTNPWQFQAAQRLLESVPTALQHRILAPAFAISASKLLLQTPQPESFPTPVNNACRAIARYTLHVLEQGIHQLQPADTALGATARMQRIIDERESAANQPRAA